jgi:hypothetical protein
MPVEINSAGWWKRIESAPGIRVARDNSICCLRTTAEPMVIRLLFAFVKYAPKGQFCQALGKINEPV